MAAALKSISMPIYVRDYYSAILELIDCVDVDTIDDNNNNNKSDFIKFKSQLKAIKNNTNNTSVVDIANKSEKLIGSLLFILLFNDSKKLKQL